MTNNLLEEIEKKISSGQIHQTSRWIFVVRTALTILGGAILILLLAYMYSFTSMHMHESIPAELFEVGSPGLPPFIHILPWALLAAVAGVAFAFIAYIRQFEFSYTNQTIYVVLLTVSALAAMFVLIEEVDTNRRVASLGTTLPPYMFVRNHYQDTEHEVMRRGVILSVNDDRSQFTMRDVRRGDVAVIISSSTKVHPKAQILPQEIIVVFGELHDDEFIATVILPERKKSNKAPRPPEEKQHPSSGIKLLEEQRGPTVTDR